MAAKDDDGELITVPGLILENNDQLRRFCEGKHLKGLSKQKRELLKSDLSNTTKEDMLRMVESERCVVN